MDNKELIKRVLGREDGYYTDDYVENIFPRQYKLMERIYNYLDKKEFSELYNMSNENHLDFFKMIKYFERDKNYYDDIGYEDLDKVVVEITKDYDLLVSTWQEDDEEVNEAVLIKTKRNLDMIKIMLMSVEMI